MMIDNLPYRQVAADDLRPGGLLCIADHASNFVPEGIELGIDLGFDASPQPGGEGGAV